MRENLRKSRLENGMTHKQISEYLHISERYYKQIEYGERIGSIEIWDMLEDLFSVHQRVLRENHPCKADNR